MMNILSKAGSMLLLHNSILGHADIDSFAVGNALSLKGGKKRASGKKSPPKMTQGKMLASVLALSATGKVSADTCNWNQKSDPAVAGECWADRIGGADEAAKTTSLTACNSHAACIPSNTAYDKTECEKWIGELRSTADGTSNQCSCASTMAGRKTAADAAIDGVPKCTGGTAKTEHKLYGDCKNACKADSDCVAYSHDGSWSIFRRRLTPSQTQSCMFYTAAECAKGLVKDDNQDRKLYLSACDSTAKSGASGGLGRAAMGAAMAASVSAALFLSVA